MISGLREIYQIFSSRLTIDMAGMLTITKFVIEPKYIEAPSSHFDNIPLKATDNNRL
ncbi:MAG: hypothetical protein PWP55_852 [Clostridiales bacterium]|nr:hypothetical protein [Clostridiales bacterium]